MNYWYQRSEPPMVDYVRTILVLEGSSRPESRPLALFTKGLPALFLKMEAGENGNEEIKQFTLFGQLTTPDDWGINETCTVIAYFFKPFILPCLFDIQVARVMEGPVHLNSWSPHHANALRIQLLLAKSTNKKLEVLNHFLLYQLEKNQKVCEIVRYTTDQMMIRPEPDILTEILKELNLQQRTFQRIFKKYVGVTPTQYRRICQFQLSFEQIRNRDFHHLTDVAFDNGFTDQSHFNRTFRDFTNLTPNDYLKSGLKGKKS